MSRALFMLRVELVLERARRFSVLGLRFGSVGGTRVVFEPSPRNKSCFSTCPRCFIKEAKRTRAPKNRPVKNVLGKGCCVSSWRACPCAGVCVCLSSSCLALGSSGPCWSGVWPVRRLVFCSFWGACFLVGAAPNRQRPFRYHRSTALPLVLPSVDLNVRVQRFLLFPSTGSASDFTSSPVTHARRGSRKEENDKTGSTVGHRRSFDFTVSRARISVQQCCLEYLL